MKNSPFLFMLVFSFWGSLQAQVKIGGAAEIPHSSAVLELDGGNNRGLLLPRMRKMDIDAIQNPAEGLTIYATDQQAVYLRRSGNWVKMSGVADAFSLPYS
jgi:trimeric autotransporter adhesin